jgi:hypothetical protein
MKAFFLKPGFEFIFSLALIVILGLPPVLLAQTAKKDLEIKIENGDTTVNGKNIKELSAADRSDALKDIKHLSGPVVTSDSGTFHRYFFKRRDTAGHREEFVEFRKRKQRDSDRKQMITGTVIVTDTALNLPETDGPRKRKMQNFTYRWDARPEGMDMRDGGASTPFGGRGMRMERRNTQNFNYVSTDNQGFSTHVNFRVSEPEHEDLQRITGVEGAKLEITDLNLVPEFSSGKTLLLFNLPSKAVADVFLKDGDGKIIWNEKCTGGSFTKAFALPLNGVYYLHVKQGGGVDVKKIVKEE